MGACTATLVPDPTLDVEPCPIVLAPRWWPYNRRAVQVRRADIEHGQPNVVLRPDRAAVLVRAIGNSAHLMTVEPCGLHG
jgi:hypothetical protein